jgi:hypothetical protein
VGQGRLSAGDLAEIIKRTQQALKRVGRVLYGEDSRRQGRDKADVEQLCELFLVGWNPGSAIAQLEFAAPPPQMHMFGYIGGESLRAFLTGMRQISSVGTAETELPPGFDQGVLQSCDSLAKVLDHGIDSIGFESPEEGADTGFTLDHALRSRVGEILGRPVDVASVARVGRLEELNGHGALTGRLWEADGSKWLCHFEPDHLEQLSDAWMRTARVVGRATIEEGRERVLDVDSVVVLEDEMTLSANAESAPFWESLSLDKLAEQQGVEAVSDLDEISALWPVDDDPDEFLQHILQEREARRRLADGGSAA